MRIARLATCARCGPVSACVANTSRCSWSSGVVRRRPARRCAVLNRTPTIPDARLLTLVDLGDVILQADDSAPTQQHTNKGSTSASPYSAPLPTVGRELSSHPGRCLLSRQGEAAWMQVLPLMRRRGALTKAVREVVARQLALHDGAAAVFPWLWPAAEEVPSGRGATSVCTTDTLRLAPPAQWVAAARRYLNQLPQATPPRELLREWHQLFFAIARNCAWSGEASQDEFGEAHRHWMEVMEVFYEHQHMLMDNATHDTSLTTTTTTTNIADDGSVAMSTSVVTRFPPILMRRLRPFYAAQRSLMLYADLVRRAMDLETTLMRKMNGPGSSVVDTALRMDGELMEYLVSAAGRRESGLSGHTQWEATMQIAKEVAQQLPRVMIFHLMTGKDADESTAVLRRCASIFMNVCMWSCNDNCEGWRCVEALRVFVCGYCEGWAELPRSHMDAARASSMRPSAVVAVLRAAALRSIFSKAERLLYAPSVGLFEVAVVASSVEVLVPHHEDDVVEEARALSVAAAILLHPRKASVAELWGVVRHHPQRIDACMFALRKLGPRLMAAVLSSTSRASVGVGKRMLRELRQWAAMLGQPLHLRSRQLEHWWMQQQEQHNESQQVSHSLSFPVHSSSAETHEGGWRCGCGDATNSLGEVRCASCSLRGETPCAWTCPNCQWEASTDVGIDSCLRCGASHPGMPPTTTQHSHDDDHQLCFVCNDCGTYSIMQGDSVRCGGCNSHSGYLRSIFLWSCGCGEMNPPQQLHCSACSSYNNPSSTTSPVPQFLCDHCGHKVSVDAAMEEHHRCSSCAHPHPRERYASSSKRLASCPSCANLVAADEGRCEACGSEMLPILGGLLTTVEDAPWLCVGCGHANPLRDDGGAWLRPQRADDAWQPLHANGLEEATCASCQAPRAHTSQWESWQCAGCGHANCGQMACTRCLSLHPNIASSATLWCCPCCSNWSPSWAARCEGAAGCGCPQTQATRRIPYAPVACEVCGGLSRSAALASCEHCAAPLPVVEMLASNDVSGSSAPDSSSPVPRLCLNPAHSARLDAVEALLLSAGAEAELTDFPPEIRQPLLVHSAEWSVPAHAYTAAISRIW